MAYDPYMNAEYGANQGTAAHHPVGLGIQYDDYDYSQPSYEEQARHSHTSSPYPPSNLSATLQPNLSSDRRRTRSGRSVTRPSTPRSSKEKPSPKLRKKAAGKMKARHITQPLSILTKHMTAVPVRDMQAWVNRSAEERQKEVAKRKGYITRPMNSFMLYRSAYAERTKAWCAENNHQVVSSVSGESWPLEPPEVREFYNELAKTERLNHQRAHPDYKFSPSKPGYAGSKKRKSAEISDEESLLTEDPDGDWAATHGVRQRQMTKPGRDADYALRNTATSQVTSYSSNPLEMASNLNDNAYRSSWEANYLGRSLPVAVDNQRLYHNQYVRSHAEPVPYAYMGTGVVENIHYAPVEMAPVPNHTYLFAAPGQSSFELQELDQPSSVMPADPHIDPTLFGYDASNIGLDNTLGANVNFVPQTEHYGSGLVFDTLAVPEHTNVASSGYQAAHWADHTGVFFDQTTEIGSIFDEHAQSASRRTSAAHPSTREGVEKLVSPRKRE